MAVLNNSPAQPIMLSLAARKSFSFTVQFLNNNELPLNIEDSRVSFTIGQQQYSANPVLSQEADSYTPTNGVALFNLQASQLDLTPGVYPFEIVVTTSGYSAIAINGELEILESYEVGALSESYSVAPSTFNLIAHLKHNRIVVTTNNLVLQGPPGETGAQGAQGLQGEVGPQGPGGVPGGPAGGVLAGTYPDPLFAVDMATQAELDALATTVSGKQPQDNDLSAIAALTPTNDDIIQRKAGAWVNRTPAQLQADLPAYAADSIINTPAGNIAAATVQAAIDELDGEKIAKALVTTKGDIIAATAASTPVRKAVGPDGSELVSDSMQSDGLRWTTTCKFEGSGDPESVVSAPVGSVYHDTTNGYFFVKKTGSGNTGWRSQGTPLPRFAWAAGQYFVVPFGVLHSAPTATLAQGVLHYAPVFVPQQMTINRVGAIVSTAGTGSTVFRLGLYNDTGAGKPGSRVADFGTVSGLATGGVEISGLTQVVSRGWYWIAVVAQTVTGSPALHGHFAGTQGFMMSTQTTMPTSGEFLAHGSYTETGVTGALPANAGTLAPGSSALAPSQFWKLA